MRKREKKKKERLKEKIIDREKKRGAERDSDKLEGC